MTIAEDRTGERATPPDDAPMFCLTMSASAALGAAVVGGIVTVLALQAALVIGSTEGSRPLNPLWLVVLAAGAATVLAVRNHRWLTQRPAVEPGRPAPERATAAPARPATSAPAPRPTAPAPQPAPAARTAAPAPVPQAAAPAATVAPAPAARPTPRPIPRPTPVAAAPASPFPSSAAPQAPEFIDDLPTTAFAAPATPATPATPAVSPAETAHVPGEGRPTATEPPAVEPTAVESLATAPPAPADHLPHDLSDDDPDVAGGAPARPQRVVARSNDRKGPSGKVSKGGAKAGAKNDGKTSSKRVAGRPPR